MYFLTVGFQKWDGYAVYNDPEVLFLLSKGILPPPSESFAPWTESPWMFILLAAVVGTVTVTLIVFRKRVKRTLSRTWTSIKSVRHKESKTIGHQEPYHSKEGLLLGAPA
jgi:hypothetical protein